MTRTDYLGWLGTLLLAGLMAVLILRPIVGERWFGLYGLASVAIPVAIAGGLLLARRHSTIGHSPWRALLFALPLLLLAAIQIGFWTALFLLGQKGTLLIMMRAAILGAADPYLPALAAALIGFLGWLLASAARETAAR